MKCTSLVVACFFMAVAAFSQQPISQHPSNLRYFLFRGKPTILISAGEHYGAVINPAFDFETYLQALHREGFNYTRIYSGTFVESPDVATNSDDLDPLAPSEGGLLCPWARSDEPSYYHGGMKFDLDRWNERYFQRLRDVVTLAAQLGIVVEVNLFADFEQEHDWQGSPMNPNNNINLKKAIPKGQALSLNNEELLEYQVALVEKMAAELNSFDNVMFKIVNNLRQEERTDKMAWQTHLADVMINFENSMSYRHLLVSDVANSASQPWQPDSRYAVMTFGQPSGTDSIRPNFEPSIVTGFDEFPQQGDADLSCVSRAWRTIISGGGIFHDTNYGFTTINPEGTDRRSAIAQVGINGRKQLAFLKQFAESFQFANMRPDATSIKTSGTTYALSQPGSDYAAYIEASNKGNLTLQLPKGSYQVVFVNIQKGEIFRSEVIKSDGNGISLPYEHPMQDWALRILRR